SGADATALLEYVEVRDGNARVNALKQYGGGVLIEGAGSAPVLSGCTLRNNQAYDFGGALYNDLGQPTLINCVVRDNVCSGDGGGVYSVRGAARFINCTIVGNTAGGAGGGVFTRLNDGSSCPDNAVFHNCVLWGNGDAAPVDQADQIAAPLNFCPPERNALAPAPFVLEHSIIEAWDGVFGGPTNSGDDPLLVDGDGHPGPGSAAIDFGVSAALPPDVFDVDSDGVTAEGWPLDRDGHARVVGAAVDAGAFEFAFDCNGNGVTDEVDIAGGTSVDCDSNGIPDECDTQADCNTNGIADRIDIAGGTSRDCNADCVPDECAPPAADCDGNGTLDICDIAAGTSPDCNGNLLPDVCESDCNDDGRPTTATSPRGPAATATPTAFRTNARIPRATATATSCPMGASWRRAARSTATATPGWTRAISPAAAPATATATACRTGASWPNGSSCWKTRTSARRAPCGGLIRSR
ncbi:MAG TPA: hypothetical protein P5572_06180, partial [Phycisphaerae bacterium]|nr:hypothetical protein [Phycisphaerae bacterium]